MRMITIAITTTVACLPRISLCAQAPSLPETIHVVATVPPGEIIAIVRIERLEAGLKARISSEPAEPANYFELADLYSFAKLDDAEEETLKGAVEAARGQSTYERLTAFYMKRWRTAEASELVTRWEKIDATAKPRSLKAMLLWTHALNAATRSDPRAALDLIEQGLAAADEAMLLSHPGDDALLVYGSKSELLKLKGELTKDPHDAEVARQQRAMIAVGAFPTPMQQLLGRMARDYASVRVVSRSDLAYPEEARYAHIQGDVPIAVEIDESGVVVEATVLGEERLPVLTRAAVEAVRHWRYEPVVVDRMPRRASALVFFSFVLKPSP